MRDGNTAFVVFAHGSRIESANEAVRAVSARMARESGKIVEPAFLELGQPNLSGAVDRLASRDVVHIIVVPYFLTLGTHLQRDLPALVRNAALHHPGIHIKVTAPLDGHPALLHALLDRANAALAGDLAGESSC
jgi:sirohydrochlorin ferrochelatase